MRWTEDQLSEHLAKMRKINSHHLCTVGKEEIHAEPEDLAEAKLQNRIETHCREKGLYCFHDRSRGRNNPGHPDLVVSLPGGRTVWVELKSKHGRLSEDQKRVRLMLLRNGAEWHEVRSFKHWLEIVAGPSHQKRG